jgi:hypothetical protein
MHWLLLGLESILAFGKVFNHIYSNRMNTEITFHWNFMFKIRWYILKF